MLAWFFAYDHTNYARYTLYGASCIGYAFLENTHPDINVYMMNRGFVVQKQTKHGLFPNFQLCIDPTIEQTMNGYTRIKGTLNGVIRKGAVLTCHTKLVHR
jgi:hypothetical protein